MDKKRFLVIGCGNVSGTYLYTLNRHPHVEVVALVDLIKQKAKEQADKYHIPSVYQNYVDALSNEKLDAAIIATPHFLHYNPTIDCFNAGLEVLCEKPLATSLEQIKKMIQMAEKKERKFGVMLQRRFYPNSESTKQALYQEKLGKLEKVSLNFTCHKTPEFYNTWRGQVISGGGVLISQALHRIDRLVYFFGNPLAVKARIQKTRDYIEVEDRAKAKIYFENGITTEIWADNSSGNPETNSIIEIKGEQGHIILSDDKTPVWDVRGIATPVEIGTDKIPAEHRPPYYGPCHEEVINDFVSSITTNKPLFVNAKDSLPAMKIIFGMYESSKQDGKKIDLDKL